jgi:hypothetical protein
VKCRLRSGLGLSLVSDLLHNTTTFLDGLVGQLKVALDVLALEVEQGKDHMGLLCWYLQVIEPRCGSDDGLDVVLPHQLGVSGGVEVSEDELASSCLWVCGEDDVVGAVVLLSIIIMKHQLL